MKFDPKMLETAAYYSQESYKDKIPDAIAIRSRSGSTVCYIKRLKDMDVIVFRGSDDWLDWTKNFMAVPVLSGGGWCHAGFVTAYKRVQRRVKGNLRPLRKTLVCGHSLGGAIAERFCMDMVFMKNCHMITFGKPNLRFKPKKALMRHMKTQLSVVNGSDAVARVPKVMFGPDPGQDVLYFPNQGTPKCERYALARAEMRLDWNLKDTAKDHNMTDYCGNVEQYLGNL